MLYVVICIFFYAKTRTSNFSKVVRQHTKNMMGVLYDFCRKFTWLSSSEKNLKIR